MHKFQTLFIYRTENKHQILPI